VLRGVTQAGSLCYGGMDHSGVTIRWYWIAAGNPSDRDRFERFPSDDLQGCDDVAGVDVGFVLASLLMVPQNDSLSLSIRCRVEYDSG
jgi:hypothetical protein